MHTKEFMSLNAATGQQDTRVTFILFEYAVDSASNASSSLSSKVSTSGVQGLMKNDSKNRWLQDAPTRG